MKRGDIWWADLGDPIASEPGYRRPVLVVQSDAFNRSGISTVVVVSLTSALKRAEAFGNVLLPKKRSGLDRDSVVNVSQVTTLDKSELIEEVGSVDGRVMKDVDEGIRLVLGL